MRPSFVLLLALALLVAFSNATSATTRMTAVSIADSNKRSLRAVQKEDGEEERGGRFDNLFAVIDVVKLGYRTRKEIKTINKLKVAAAGKGAKAAKAEEKLKAMKLKAAAAGNDAVSAKKAVKEARIFKILLSDMVEPKRLYQTLKLDRLGDMAVTTNVYKFYQRKRLQTAKMDR
ncbi:hypothetical protein G195_011683 [Phytophthora kernoviae 00238/432]|uniref:RxLR effector protein n=1 Tax=Phytophthora kernoviae 00238/432 TaxID=1284355 RepID=A0A8J4S4C0_9STRA|nr:hypothetical protein G195_011683 [Phytophthora kernoviae 00238/432]